MNTWRFLLHDKLCPEQRRNALDSKQTSRRSQGGGRPPSRHIHGYVSSNILHGTWRLWPAAARETRTPSFCNSLAPWYADTRMSKIFYKDQRWSNIFGFDSDSNLFPRISNIRIRIREFWRPNNIRIFESFSSNLEYLKHIFHLDFEYKLVIFSCPADLLIPFSGTNGQDLCLDVTVTWYL